jgi:hypothetical protein
MNHGRKNLVAADRLTVFCTCAPGAHISPGAVESGVFIAPRRSAKIFRYRLACCSLGNDPIETMGKAACSWIGVRNVYWRAIEIK